MASGPDFAFRVHALLKAAPDGRAKLWTIWRALQLRRDRPALFAHGDYEAVTVTGTRAQHAVAYARRHDKELLVLVAGRLFASLGLAAGEAPTATAWGDTVADLSTLPGPGRLTDVQTGTSFDVDPQRPSTLAQLLAHFPVAILHGQLPVSLTPA